MHCRRVTIHTDCVIPCHNDCHALTLISITSRKLLALSGQPACYCSNLFISSICFTCGHMEPAAHHLQKALIASYMYLFWLFGLPGSCLYVSKTKRHLLFNRVIGRRECCWRSMDLLDITFSGAAFWLRGLISKGAERSCCAMSMYF
jgi:hypothetical protein